MTIQLSPRGAVAGVLGEVPQSGYASNAEEAWLATRDRSQEATFAAVGRNLLAGAGTALAATPGAAVPERLGRNLLTEAEHAAHQRSARALVRDLPRAEKASGADEIARRGKDDPGVSYLRDNADGLIDELATKQAKAAQTLIDTYGTMATLRQSVREVDERIPANQPEQALWVTRARSGVTKALDALPSDTATPLRERLAQLGEGTNPARWFVTASELSDGLLRAAVKASRAEGGEVTSAAIDDAKRQLDSGLADPSLWGDAARIEARRSAGYARRYGQHIDSFEGAFTTLAGDGNRVADPQAFRRLLSGEGDPLATEALRSTLDSARATADVAEEYGKKGEAARLRKAIGQLERTSRQADTILAARGSGVSRETGSDTAALDWLALQSAGVPADGYVARQLATGQPGAAVDFANRRLEARGGVFRAVAAIQQTAAASNARAVRSLLSPPQDDEAPELEIAAPTPPRLDTETFDAHRDHVERMATDPNYFASAMAQSFGTMPEAAPEVYGALSEQTAKVVQYLYAVAPGGSTGGPMRQRIPVGADELWEYNQRFQAVADPEFVPENLAAGQLSSQAIEAYQVIHPRQYAALQIDTYQRLEELQQAGIPVPVQAREQLDVLLGIDGGGDPALTWKVAERAYAAIARKNATRSLRADNPSAGEQGLTSTALSTLNNGASAIAQTG